MRIPSLEDLPSAANRATWAKELHCHQSTLYRAEIKGQLKRANPGASNAIYTRKAVLKWLGLDQELVIESATLRSLRKASKAYAER
jgi:hypothetical protein